MTLLQQIGPPLLVVTLCLNTASGQLKRPAPTLANAEQLESIAKQSCRGSLGCGIGTFQFTDHAGNKRQVISGLDAMHVFGREISARTISSFLQARAKANQIKNGPLHGERQYLMFTALGIVERTQDPQFIKDLTALLTDPNPKVRRYVQGALLFVGDGHPSEREAILKALAATNWDPKKFAVIKRDWLKGI